MTKYLVYLKNAEATIMVIADKFEWNDTEVVFKEGKMICAVFRMSEIAGWCAMNDGGDAE